MFRNQKVTLIPQKFISIQFLKEKLFFLGHKKIYFLINCILLQNCIMIFQEQLQKFTRPSRHILLNILFCLNMCVPLIFLSSLAIFNLNFFANSLLLNIFVKLCAIILKKVLNNGLNAQSISCL